MDLLLSLSLLFWGLGGAVCFCWIGWLDRDRREISPQLKTAVIFAWPVLMPWLLYRREDITGFEGIKTGAVWSVLFVPGFVSGAALLKPVALTPEPPAAERISPPSEPISFEPAVLPPRRSPRERLYVPPDGAATGPTEQDRREAIRHWNSGIISFQKGDFERAREDWRACIRLDPANLDCEAGLQRIALSYGGSP
jgi:hypothetical protein